MNSKPSKPPEVTIALVRERLESCITLLTKLTFFQFSLLRIKPTSSTPYTMLFFISASSIGFNIKEMSGIPGVTLSDSEVSSSVYKIAMSGDGVVQTYTFTKTSSDTLNFSLSTSGMIQNLDGFEKR